MKILELLKVILIGIIEGITEWLPISSTGHMLLFDEFITLNMSESFKEMFFVVIQLGAILSVIILYFTRLNPFKRENHLLLLKLALATLPAAIIGFSAAFICEELLGVDLDTLLFNPQIVASTLIIYGIIFILVEGSL